jgi:hypothetical protein
MTTYTLTTRTTLYKSLTHTQTRALSLLVYNSPFLATDFNIRTIIASLTYTLQISHIKSARHCSTVASNSFPHSLPYRTASQLTTA